MRSGAIWALMAFVSGVASACATPASPPSPSPSASAASAASAAPVAAPPATVTPAAQRLAPGAACEGDDLVAVLPSPALPVADEPLRLLVAVERPMEGRLALLSADGAEVATSDAAHGGPPYWWSLTAPSVAAGSYRAVLWKRGEPAPTSCTRVEVSDAPVKAAGRAWPVERAWDRSMENLYSAWIEALFDAPLAEQPAWPALHEVLRDRSRNLLHNHLALGEDDDGSGALKIIPDCADLPYFLRAYFAFKLRLPFGYSRCSRGGSSAPTCVSWKSEREGMSGLKGGAKRAFGAFLRQELANAVHSGNGRVAADDDRTDYYSTRLSAETIRPGAVYADPYGHLLVVVRRIAQTADAGGVLLAVDGQPDGTVARRRFWRGNFLFAQDPSLGSPGFKHFRPVVREKGRERALTNAEILAAPGYGDVSDEQDRLGVEGFYDRMDEVLSPRPLDPTRALLETIQALDEQVQGRVLSVANGEKYKAGGGAKVDMPEGSAIFQTVGPWEDFSTPSRDLRLLIAIDIVRRFPDRVASHPDRYLRAKGQDAGALKAELEARLAKELGSRSITYTRSDGSPHKLSLAEVLGRAEALEMAYNPNDCVEVRWGAADQSDERSTCKRRAPADQRAAMRKVRAWFAKRQRPVR